MAIGAHGNWRLKVDTKENPFDITFAEIGEKDVAIDNTIELNVENSSSN